MNSRRLESLLSRFANLSIMVVGDFFLDKYLVIDPLLSEPSLETGLDSQQVIHKRSLPGAAGNVIVNLQTLGVGNLHALGFTGDDGEGYELRQGLSALGVSQEGMFYAPDRVTPTYIKPMKKVKELEHEINRIDIQNRSPISSQLEERIITFLSEMMPTLDGLIVQDQVGQRNTGVVTERVRGVIGELGSAHPEKVILADSRQRIGEFRNILRKANRNEVIRAAKILKKLEHQEFDNVVAEAVSVHGLPELSGQVLYENGGLAKERAERPLFITLGPDGLLMIDGNGCHHIPGIHVDDPVDTVGAGDSVTAGIASSLCAGATHIEAGMVGNLTASITVRQLGVTGKASPGQMLDGLRTLMTK